MWFHHSRRQQLMRRFMLFERTVNVCSGTCCRFAASVLLLAFILSASAPAATVSPSLPTLTTADQVHSLNYQEAVRKYPVHLSRVQVLYYNAALGNLFVRDSTHGVYIDMRGDRVDALHAGDFLEVEGETGPGGFAPDVEHARLRVIAPGILPPAPRYSLDHLLSGVEDCQWVEVQGIVHSVEESKHITTYANQAAAGSKTVLVRLATGAGQLTVIVQAPNGIDYSSLIDSNVMVRGVSGPRFNERRQLIGIHLFVQSFAQFHVSQHGADDPFSLPIRELDTIMQHTPGVAPGHRIRVRGVVTAKWDHRFVSISDGIRGLFLRTISASDLKVGDRVDVVGFPATGDYSPVLEDVIYRRIGGAALPPPLNLDAAQIFKGVADAELVRIRGRLLKQTFTQQESTLLMTAGEQTFTAVLPAASGQESPDKLRDGSILDLTGTCYVEVFPDKTPRAIQILLRSPRDIIVVEQASWWTAGHTIAAVAILVVAVVLAFLWITLLRRRVRAQTEALEKAHEEAAAITELARAMQEVTTQRNLTARVSASGSEQIAQLGIGFNRMLSELEVGDHAKKEAEDKLQHQALTDELTGLPNRRSLSERLAQSLFIAQRDQRTLALLYIDLDGFKLVNDSLGHPVGDQLLIQVARRLRSRIRQSDTLARIGGDEFTVVLTTLRIIEEAEKVATSLLEVLSEEFVLEGHKVNIGASIGIGVFPRDAADPTTLLQQADSAMYAAKGSGKNQVRWFTPDLRSSVCERLSLDNELRGAIAREEIHLQYQPEFEVSTQRLRRFEALARWTHRTLGVIPPAKFIPVAEESGQIVALGAYLMEQACMEAVKWQAPSGRPIQVAVNVSSLQFKRPTFVDEVAAILARTGLSPELLQIELTESIMLTGIERAAATMHRLRGLGVSLAIDDFGTGYSCLSYLPRLPFDTMKIDRSFVSELESNPGARAIVSLLVSLAHRLNMQVVVEGVQTQQQLEMIRELNGNEVQGFLLGRPTRDPQSLLRNGENRFDAELISITEEVSMRAL